MIIIKKNADKALLISTILFIFVFYVSPFQHKGIQGLKEVNNMAKYINYILKPFFLGNTSWTYFSAPATSKAPLSKSQEASSQYMIVDNKKQEIKLIINDKYFKGLNQTRVSSSSPPVIFQKYSKKFEIETIREWICRYISVPKKKFFYVISGSFSVVSTLRQKLTLKTEQISHKTNGQTDVFKINCY
jgi:hypothetical protein